MFCVHDNDDNFLIESNLIALAQRTKKKSVSIDKIGPFVSKSQRKLNHTMNLTVYSCQNDVLCCIDVAKTKRAIRNRNQHCFFLLCMLLSSFTYTPTTAAQCTNGLASVESFSRSFLITFSFARALSSRFVRSLREHFMNFSPFVSVTRLVQFVCIYVFVYFIVGCACVRNWVFNI